MAEPHGWNKDAIYACVGIPFVPFLWFQTGLHQCPAKLYLGHGIAGLSKSYENFDFLIVKNMYRRRSCGLQSPMDRRHALNRYSVIYITQITQFSTQGKEK
jgi:hypothetical protein